MRKPTAFSANTTRKLRTHAPKIDYLAANSHRHGPVCKQPLIETSDLQTSKL